MSFLLPGKNIMFHITFLYFENVYLTDQLKQTENKWLHITVEYLFYCEEDRTNNEL